MYTKSFQRAAKRSGVTPKKLAEEIERALPKKGEYVSFLWRSLGELDEYTIEKVIPLLFPDENEQEMSP